MSELYNRPFKIGAAVFAMAFVVVNAASYIEESRSREAWQLRFAQMPKWPLVWGWPFPWVDWVAAANLAILLFGALFFGLLVRWILSLFK